MPNPRLTGGQPTHFRWKVFVLACGTSWLLYFHRYLFALIKPTLAVEWGLGKVELGLLDSAFSVFYSVFQIPLGIATDLAGVRLVLTAMIVVWSLGLGILAWPTSSRIPLWVAQAVMGLGQSAVLAALSRVTRTWFPVSVRTTLQGWVGIFFARFGGVSANLLAGSLMIGVFHMPWRTVVVIMMGVGIAHAVLFAAFFRNFPRQHPAVNGAEVALIEGPDAENGGTGKAARTGMRELLRRMSRRSIANLLMLNVQMILSTLADNIYSSWIPLFLAEVHGLKFKEMGIYSALPLLGGALGGAAGGWLNDSLIARTGNRRWSRSLVGFAGKGLAGVLLLIDLYFWYDSPRFFCVMLFFVKFFSDWSLTTTWGTVTDIGGRTSATVFAFNNSVAGIASIIGPVMYGAVAEHSGWTPVFITAAVTYIACAATWLLINCNIPVLAVEPTVEKPAGG